MSSTIRIEASLLSFPEKLWYLVNDPKCDEISWNADGITIVIPNNQSFSNKILNSQSRMLFKTNNFASFVRQLNLYGFRKVTEHRRRGHALHLAIGLRSEFKHPCFRKDRRDLLPCVRRQNIARKEQTATKKEDKPPRSSPPPSYQYALPQTSSASTTNPWTMWDSYLQAMNLFPYLPPQYSMAPSGAGVGSYGDQFTTYAHQGPGFYGRDPQSMGLAYASSYCPSPGAGLQMYPFTTGLHEGARVSYVTDSQIKDLNGHVTATTSSSNSKPAVVTNDALSTKHDVTDDGYYGKGDVICPIHPGNTNRSENKKPFPAQSATHTNMMPHNEGSQVGSRNPSWRDVYSDKVAIKLSEPAASRDKGSSAELKSNADVMVNAKSEGEELCSNKNLTCEVNEESAAYEELPSNKKCVTPEGDGSREDKALFSNKAASGINKEERTEREELPRNRRVNDIGEDENTKSGQLPSIKKPEAIVKEEELPRNKRLNNINKGERSKRQELPSYKRAKLEINANCG